MTDEKIDLKDHAWKPDKSDDQEMGFFDAAEDMFDRYAEETESAVKSGNQKFWDAAESTDKAVESGIRRTWMERDDYDDWKDRD